MADGGGSRRQRAAGANSPAAAPVSELLQQLKALGAGAANQGGRGGGSKTYAGLAAAAGRSPPQAQAGGGAGGSAVQEPLLGRHSSGGSYSREQRGTSAFFKRQGNADPASKVLQQQPQRRSTPAAGSATPPTRPLARVSTPDSAASPFLEDDCLLFQMSGLRLVRTSSRTGASHGSGLAQQQQQQQQQGMPRTKSAPAVQAAAAAAAAVAGLSPPLSRAFSFAGEPSPRSGAAPVPIAARQGPPAQTSAVAAAGVPRGSTISSNRHRRGPNSGLDEEIVAAVGQGHRSSTMGIPTWRAAPEADSPAPAAGTDYAGPAGVYGEDAGAAAAAAEEEEEELPAAPHGWSEELLNWMLSEKAGLLVEAQRAQRRQAELAAELDRLRARGGGAEREVQRLLAERRSLLDRVQQLSSAEAEANAAVERLCMENDALASDLERSQEVCREMLAARRAARDALADMSAQNARLLAAYVEKKQEAAHLQDALRRQQRQSEAHIRALEEQLQAAQAAANQGLPCSPRSPPCSPPPQAEHASPAGSTNTAEGQLLGAEDSEQSVTGPAGSNAATPERAGSSPLPNKENANVGSNSRQGNSGSGGSRGQPKGPAKGQWDVERSELLSLLERLQHQLSTHAEQQQAAATGGRSLTPKRKAAAGGGCAPPPSRFCQPVHGEAEQEEPWTSPPHAATPAPPSEEAGSDDESCQTGGSLRAGGAAGNLQASFESVSGGSSGASEPTASPCHSPGYTTEGGSPAVMAHHHMAADSPTTERSARRSDAPSPPSVRQQRPPMAAASPADEPTPCSAAPPAKEGASAAKPPHPADQQAQQQPQQRCKTPTGHTMEAFLGPSPGGSGKLPAAMPSVEQAERLQQAEQRAADLEAELEGLRRANAAAEERVAWEERRRAAESAKAAGNAAFQAQRFEEAVQYYSAGLDAGAARKDAGLGAVLLCNRAAALHACGRFLDALADCWRAEALDAGYARVYHLRADAYWALGAYDAAAEDLARLVKRGAGPDVAARLADAQRRSQAQQPVNHYAVLGVPPAATPGEIRSAYRQLALKFHPDKAGGSAAAGAGLGLGPDAAGALFMLASEAHRVLADAEQRRHHDIAALRHKYRRFYNHAF